MRSVPVRASLNPLVWWMAATTLTGCVSFNPAVQSSVEDLSGPLVAILRFGFDLEITELSTVKTVEGTLSTEDESK